MWNLGLLGAAGIRTGDFELITTTILSSSQPSVTFNNLGDYSSTYKHLQIRVVSRSTQANNLESFLLRMNGISSASYSYHQMYESGSSVASFGIANNTSIVAGFSAGANAGTNIFSANVIDILDPFSTTKNTTTRSFLGSTGAASGVRLYSGSFINTASITSLEVRDPSANFVTGSRFSLYGIRG
jgi:hypothetical protein